MGGHPDARRVWARKEPGRWNRRTYGTIARIAWQAEVYVNEFYAWKEAGCPEREPFTSLAVSLPRLELRMRVIKGNLAQVAKPVPSEDKSVEGKVIEKEDDDGNSPF
jgi:hypothetical protein